MPLPVTDWEDHKLFFLEKSAWGNHVMGGKKPEDLVLPAHDQLNTPFQYLGTIDGTDSLFSWMKMDKLHLVYPLYECNFGIYLDYTEPNRPKILNPETFADYWYRPDFATLNNVEFSETRYQVTTKIKAEKCMDMETGQETNNVLLCGVPIWYQAQEVPVCPKTNEVMSYICTINSDPAIQVVNKPSDQKYPFDAYLIFGLGTFICVFSSGVKNFALECAILMAMRFLV